MFNSFNQNLKFNGKSINDDPLTSNSNSVVAAHGLFHWMTAVSSQHKGLTEGLTKDCAIGKAVCNA